MKKVVSVLDRLEDSLLALLYKRRMVIFVAAITALALYVRIIFAPFDSLDTHDYLAKWLDEIREVGGFRSLGTQIGNYTPLYHYLLAAVSYIPGLSTLMMIKYTSILADFVLAGLASWLVWLLCKNKVKAVLAYAVVLALPTVVMNASLWGQCDAMYTSLLVLCACLWARDKRSWAMAAFGVALAVKLQAVFLLPALLVFVLCGHLRMRQLLVAPAAWVLAFLPAIIAGGWDWGRLLGAYSMQTGEYEYQDLAMNVQNLSSWLADLPKWNIEMFTSAVLVCAVLALGCVAFYAWNRKNSWSRKSEWLLMLFMLCFVPYILPRMHERYFFAAEIGLLVYALVNPRRWYLPVLMQFVSIPNYLAFLRNIKLPYGAWMVPVLAVPAVVLFWDYRRSLKARAVPALRPPRSDE